MFGGENPVCAAGRGPGVNCLVELLNLWPPGVFDLVLLRRDTGPMAMVLYSASMIGRVL